MDKEYWKKIYQPKWTNGKRRAETIKTLIELWDFKVEPFGFLPTSTDYVKNSPDEKGKPDWLIIVTDKCKIPLEVTGTKYSRGADDIWIRNDKFEYAEKHQELECWVGHVLESKELVRFIKFENKDKYPLENREINGNMETYRIIPEDETSITSAENFEKYLNSLRKK
jgi:hypothetical protein